MVKIAKNIVAIIGVFLCAIVFLLNIFCISMVDIYEVVNIKLYSVIELIISLIVIALILLISKILNEKLSRIKMWKKVLIFIAVLVVYVIIQVKWINVRDANPAWDQLWVYETAERMYNDNIFLINKTYLQFCPHQLPLAVLYSFIFKIFNRTDVVLLQYINAIANAFSMLGIFLITKQLEKKYETNNFKPLIISFCFITLPLLSTFIYGDIISIPMCLLGIWFIMKYSEKENFIYLILSSIFIAISYIARMNNLIYIIAISIYILLDLLETKNKTIKDIVKKSLLFMLFIAISILPETYIKSYWQEKLELNKEDAIPVEAYFCMGMNESSKANGWYNNEYVQWAYENVENSKQKYNDEIKYRLKFFLDKPFECIKFYTLKIASMWSENTYASLLYNHSYAFGNLSRKDNDDSLRRNIDDTIYNIELPIAIFQKSLILIIFGSTIIVLIKYRKNISIDVLLLVIVFIGGFLFHVLWEAKSRYIISYIIVLIPITSVVINDYIKYKGNKILAKFIKDENMEE